MSEVRYAGLVFPLVKTNSLAQEAIYSADGMDYIYTKYTLDVTVMLNLESIQISKSSADDDALSQASTIEESISEIRRIVLQPRQPFRFSFSQNGPAIVDVGGVDLAGGPFPKAFTITAIKGANTAIATFRIEAHGRDAFLGRDDCGPDQTGNKLREILSNRFSVATSYDQDMYATRDISGLLVFAGQRGLNPDDFRNIAMPSLPRGFRRKSMSFKISSSGLSLEYGISDTEQFDLDRTVTTSSGSYREWTTKYGAKLYGEATITLSAPKNFDKRNMISRAVEIASSRFQTGDTLQTASITEELFENKISLKIEALKGADKIKRAPAGAFLFGPTLGGIIDDRKIKGVSPKVIKTINILPPRESITDKLPDKDVRTSDQGILSFRTQSIDPQKKEWFPPDQSADLSVRNQEIISAVIAVWRDQCGQDEIGEGRYAPFDQDPPEDDIDDPAPDITISEIEVDETYPEPLYSGEHRALSESGRTFLFTDAVIHTDYITETHTIQLPIASDPVGAVEAMEEEDKIFDENVFVNLGRPTMVKRVTFTFTRTGGPPIIPKAVDAYIVPGTVVEARLLRKNIKPATATLEADGVTKSFRITGIYEYGFSRALREEEKALDISVAPWTRVETKSNGKPFLDEFGNIKDRTIPTNSYKIYITEDGANEDFSKG